MLPPDELIGQKVWITVERDPDYPDLKPYQLQAELTQPTAPPWFFARFEDPPPMLRIPGKWLTLYEAQQAVLLHPVIDYELEADSDYDDEFSTDEFHLS